MDVSIIFVNYNTCRLTINAIRSVYLYTKMLKFEIIIIDNNSIDDSVKTIKEKYPEIIIIKNRKNIGFGQANNKGIEIAKGKYCLLLNTDTYLVNNAIEIFFEFMEKPINNDAVIVGGTLIKQNGEKNISWGYLPNFKLFVKGSIWRHFYKKEFYINEIFTPITTDEIKPYLVDYISGADFFVRSQVIKEVGGFNKCFFMYFEETELTLRIKRKIQNAKVFLIPQAKIVHIGQGSDFIGKKSIRFQLRYLKSKALYFRFQNGIIASFMVYISGVVKVFLNK